MNFLLLQQLQIEPAAMIGEVVKAAGHSIDPVCMDQGDHLPESLSEFDGVIVMGGPMSANDRHLPFIVDELALLREAIRIDLPVLGVCLGAQLLAKAAGAEILTSPVRELGWYPIYITASSEGDPLFSTLDDGLDVFQWHGETFTLPDAATLVATHPEVPNQAFRIGSSQYGLQFHIEVDALIMEAWIEAGESERQALGDMGVEQIRNESPEKMAAAHRFCTGMVSAWLGLALERRG